MAQAIAEWDALSQYMYADFYVLTPLRNTTDEANWTVYEYFDAEKNSGAVQAFRPSACRQSVCKVQVKGLDPDKHYTVRDIDGVNSVNRVKGSALMRGLPLYAANPRTAITVYIEPVE